MSNRIWRYLLIVVIVSYDESPNVLRSIRFQKDFSTVTEQLTAAYHFNVTINDAFNSIESCFESPENIIYEVTNQGS